MVLKLTSAGKLFDALITLTQNKLLRIPVLFGLKSIFMSASMAKRTKCRKIIDININKPKNDLVTRHEIGEEATQF